MMDNSITAKRIYLDHAATTPIKPEVIDAMADCSRTVFGNPSSLHTSGRLAKQAISSARSSIAEGLNADPEEIIFTSGGSEADNLALIGTAYAHEKQGGHIITSAIEHHAVLETCEFLETRGLEITYLPVDNYGMVGEEDLRNAITPETILISIMHANNEIGSIQPIKGLAEIAHQFGVLFHTDAVQTVGQINTKVDELEVDLLSLSAHKFYGPKGVGALYVKKGIELVPLIHGGAQEGQRRAGTENTPGLVGMSKALSLALSNMHAESERLVNLRNKFWETIKTGVRDVRLNGHPELRLPNNLNLSFKDVEAEGILIYLNRSGIDASMGSACTSESIDPSHVIEALHLPQGWDRGSIRISLGSETTLEDVLFAAKSMVEYLNA